MKEINFISLIHKEQVGELTPSESVVLAAWVSQNEDNRATYEDTVEVWKLTGGYSPSLTVDVSSALEKQLTHIRSYSTTEEVHSTTQDARIISLSTRKWVLRIAAIMLFAVSATVLFRSAQTDSYTSANTVQYVQLEDGSSIWLDKNSQLTVDRSFNKSDRKVQLTGKAFFDIQRDEERPFVIQSEGTEVAVLGTSFTIDALDGTPEVSVKSGTVKVAASQEEVIITKGQKVSADVEGSLETTTSDASDWAWTNPDLSFKDAPLSQVLADLSKHFNVNLVYRGGVDLAKCPFTSKSLKDATLQEVLDILEITYDMKIKKKSDTEIRLTRIRCRK